MEKQFSHLIITRFNLRNKIWDNTTKNNTPTLTNKWLEERFELFETYCLPSVVNQSNQVFEWWIFFDEETPVRFRDKIKQIATNNPIIRVYFVDGMDAFLPQIQSMIKALPTPYVITSRLDNDDCIHKDYVQYVQKAFLPRAYLAIDITEGYSIQIEPIVMIGKRSHLYNPFISLIEKSAAAESVWNRNHRKWKKETRMLRIKNKRLWLSIIHVSNKVNDYTAYDKVNIEEVLEQFSLSEQTILQLKSRVEYKPLVSLKNKLKTKINNGFKDLKKNLGFYKKVKV